MQKVDSAKLFFGNVYQQTKEREIKIEEDQ
jgi:hypothetical protein